MSPRQRVPLTIEHILLGLIRAGPTHGYEVYRRLSRDSDLRLIWRVKRSQLYALLDRLEAEGYLAATLEPGAGRPPRRMLEVTDEGAQAFRQWESRPVSHGREMRIDFLAKLYFARQRGPEGALDLIARQGAACKGWLADLEDRMARLPLDGTYERLVYLFRLEQTRAMLQWLETCGHLLTVGDQ